jgi:hypothetical protein
VTESEENIRAFREWQLERELTARQQISRGCGLALIDLTSILEERHAVLDRGVDPLGIVLVAFAARGRRLLRAAYQLLDGGASTEAVPLLRVLSEYLIVGRWLVKHSDRLDAWAMADHDRRDLVITRVIRELGDEDEETKAALEEQLEELRTSRKRWVQERGEPTGQLLNVEQMAAEVGLGLAYQLAYRTQSEADVHATTLAVDNCYERIEGDRLRLLPRPRHALDAYDQYELGAHMLRDLLATTNDHVRSFLWTSGIEGTTAALNAARESDPRTAADPIQHVVSRSEKTGEAESA